MSVVYSENFIMQMQRMIEFRGGESNKPDELRSSLPGIATSV